MRLTLVAPFDTPTQAEVRWPAGRTLGDVCAPHADAITGCMINGRFPPRWRDVVPAESDHVTLFVATTYGIELIPAIIYAVVSTVISIALNYIIRALTPTHTPSNTAGKTEAVYGIAGMTNTTALGTPRFFVYGTRRVYGHIIGTHVTLEPSGRGMRFDILYFMGVGPIQAITALQINDTPLEQFPGVTHDERLGGTDNDTVIQGFDSVRKVWSDTRTLELSIPIVYTTKDDQVISATLFFATPYLFRQATNGANILATHTIHIETAPVSTGIYTDDPNSPATWTDYAQNTRFMAFGITFDHPDQWLIRVTLTATTNQTSTPPSLFNVEEVLPGSYTYPGDSLLAFHGIASSQIQSFEGMRGSGLVKGRLVKQPVVVGDAWDGVTTFIGWSDNRADILRDFWTNPAIRLGHALPEALWDDVANFPVRQYWEEDTGFDVKRDSCNALINDKRAFVDWSKVLTSEGRSILVMSGAGTMVLLVDKAQSPGLLYAMPGNIVEGSVEVSMGDGQGLPVNSLLVQFPDESANYQLQPYEFVVPGAEAEPVRQQSMTYYTLTTIAHVFWRTRYEALRLRLAQRHFRWQAPQGALVSDPLDSVALSYETADGVRGYSGFCSGDSAADRVVFDRLVPLEGSTTARLTVQHQATNTIEQQTLTIATSRDYGSVDLDPPFDLAPARGDLWALAPTSTAVVAVVIESTEVADDGTVSLTATEYQGSIHEYPEPPAALGQGVQRLPHLPPPLWDASVTENVQVQPDGSVQNFLVFHVTPGPVVHAGQAQAGASFSLTLDATEPQEKPPPAMLVDALQGYYIGAVLTITDGTGAGQVRTIVDDLRFTNTVTIDTDWDVTPDATSLYTITWPTGTDTAGFVLLQSQVTFVDPDYVTSAFVPIATVQDVQYVLVPDTGAYVTAFQFIPFNAAGQKNYQAPWYIVTFVQGVTQPPSPPGDA